MKQDNTNSTPLWRKLNEARTQGTLIVDGDMIICTDNPETYPKDYNDGIVVFETATAENTTDECIVAHFAQQSANKRYTALAVNNLHKLAEALTRIREASLQGLEMHANGEKFSFETLAGFVAEISGEALADIS